MPARALVVALALSSTGSFGGAEPELAPGEGRGRGLRDPNSAPAARPPAAQAVRNSDRGGPHPPAVPDDSPGVAQPTGALHAVTLSDYDFIRPEGWHVVTQQDHLLLTQSPDGTGCVIQVLPPQPSSGNLQTDARAVFELMYAGWQYQQRGERQYRLTRGVLPRGLEFFMQSAPMRTTSADGRYHLEDGVALVVKAGTQVAIIAARHRSMLAHHACERNYATWARFFASFSVKGAPEAPAADDPARRIIGVWAQSESGASSECVFAANGRYAFTGALGTASTVREHDREQVHLRTYAFDGDGRYAIERDGLALTLQRGGESERMRLRFEQVNHGGTGWKDRLCLLKTDRYGESEVRYERAPKVAD